MSTLKLFIPHKLPRGSVEGSGDEFVLERYSPGSDVTKGPHLHARAFEQLADGNPEVYHVELEGHSQTLEKVVCKLVFGPRFMSQLRDEFGIYEKTRPSSRTRYS
ncbi:hypothetical protein AcW1_002832 [Taiwanofungus camphoratus]|nr:hypothetical protein AcW1_002832 [Antrodia cinnamomea]